MIIVYIHLARCLEALPKSVLRIIDTQDVCSQRLERVVSKGICDVLAVSEAKERECLHKADVIMAIQPEEAEVFRRLAAGKQIITAGVDMDCVSDWDDTGIHHGRVLIVGSDNPMNVQGLQYFLEAVWPAVIAETPRATLRVVGKLALKVQADCAGVELIGPVPDLDAEYREAAIVINATQTGTGLKIKTLEALCHGKALVTWPNGIEGLPDSDTLPYRVCETPEQFIQTVNRLLTIDEERQELQRCALAYAQTHFSAASVYAELDDCLKAASSRGGRHGGC